MTSEVRRKALERAAGLVGGKHRLRDLLGVPMRDLEAWLEDREPAPTHIFLKTVDLISGPPAPGLVDGRILSVKAQEALDRALEAALVVSGTAMGNLQIRTADGLVIAVQRGFDKPFLDYFACVHDEGTCGAAAQKGARVIVADVACDPIFAGTPAAPVMAAAGVRAVQSTPLVTQAGRLVGMLSTHYSEIHHPSERDLALIGRIAQHTADLLESGTP